MDGQEQTTIHDFTTVQWPNGLALDYINEVLYWIDAKYDHVGSSNLDGSNKRIITSISNSHPYFMSYFRNVLYWSTWGKGDTTVRSLRVIGRGGVDGVASGTELVVNVTSTFNPTGVQVISRERQPLGEVMCVSVCLFVVVVVT